MAGGGFAIAAGVIGLAVAVLYVGIMVAEGESDSGIVVAFTIFLVVNPRLCGWRARPRRGGRLEPGSSRSTSPQAVPHGGRARIFSIGLPLLIAGILCLGAWVRVARSVGPVPAGAPLLSLAAAIVTGGLLAVWLLGS